MSTQVVTYTFAYVPGRIDLCATCAESPSEFLPALGPVDYGAHAGVCHQCEADHDAVSNVDILALRDREAAAGHVELVEVCDRALAGDAEARTLRCPGGIEPHPGLVPGLQPLRDSC
jgi:hypothetical protein